MAAAGPTGDKELVKAIPVAALVGDQGWGVPASKRWVWGGKAPYEDLPGGGGAGDVPELGHRALRGGPACGKMSVRSARASSMWQSFGRALAVI